MRKPLLILTLCLICLLLPVRALAGTGEISGTVFVDDGSGIRREGGRTVAGASVTLYKIGADGGETQLARVTTQADGAYGFTALGAGQYRLRASLPDTFLFILPREGGSVMLPASGSDSFSMPIDIADGQKVTDAHIGAARSSTYIKVLAFEDLNQNGGRSTTELLLRGVDVTLYYEMNGEPVEIASARTNQEGEALFLHLTPGTYRVGAVLPAPYIIGPLGEKISQWYNCVPPSDSNAGMTGPVTAPKGDSLGVGVGAVSSGSLTGSIWWDEDCDGRRGKGESGYAEATVQVASAAAGVNRSATTGKSGEYHFDGLLAGNYTLTVTLPEDAMFTVPGGDSLLTEGYAFTASRTVTVQDQTVAEVYPIGVMPATSLRVTLYNDMNTNGLYDEGEPPFAGASLEVLKNDAVRASALSDGDGVARIPVLRGGDQEVRLCLPDGQVFTVDGAQNDFSALAATDNMTLPVTVPHGGEVSLFAGVTLPASVSGTLFDDVNLTGVMEDGESGLAGFTVQAVNAEGTVALQAVTDENGEYNFRNLLPAPHTIRFLLKDAYVASDLSEAGMPDENHIATQTAGYGETAVLSLTPGLSLDAVDGGIFRSATVSGCVLLDTGIPSLPASGGMEGVTVTLLDEENRPVSSTTTTRTDADGAYYLKGALPGSYKLQFTLPDNGAFSDTSLNESSIRSDVFSLQVADDLEWEPVYAIYTGSLEGAVYRSALMNGRRDDGEEGLADIRIQMENSDLGLSYETATRADGQYSFPHLRPGSYTLRMTLPDGLCFAYDESSPVAAQVNAAAESDILIGIDDQQTGRDIAAAAPAALRGTVYFDRENNGDQDAGDNGAPGVTLSFTSTDTTLSYTVLTDEDGLFSLDALVPGSYLLRATLDADCTVADSNAAQLRDGYWMSRVTLTDGMEAWLQYPVLRYASVAGHVWNLDGSLNGVSGRAVSLYTEGVGEPLSETVTDENGFFRFSSLKPGSYKLTCDLPDARYHFARPVDAEMYPGTPDVPVGYYDYFAVAMGSDLSACDIGIGAMGELGDTAWLDLNGNGLQDGNEPCLPGIRIALYQYGALAAETVTDNQGRYRVTDLYPGVYTLKVTYPQELKPTRMRDDFPLAASVLSPSEDTVAEATGVVVPSDGRNLNCDFGFVLRQEGVYPAELKQLYATDWSYGGTRR